MIALLPLRPKPFYTDLRGRNTEKIITTQKTGTAVRLKLMAVPGSVSASAKYIKIR